MENKDTLSGFLSGLAIGFLIMGVTILSGEMQKLTPYWAFLLFALLGIFAVLVKKNIREFFK